MTTKTKNIKANTTAPVTTKFAKAQTSMPETKNATRAQRDGKDSTTDTKRISQIEAAIMVLGKSKEAMNCKAIVEAMVADGLWSSPGGATPAATLYASILREIQAKGDDSRFRKTGRGQFTLATNG